MIPVILASASPRRKELIRTVFPEVIIHPAEIEEIPSDKVTLDREPEYLSLLKARAVAADHPDALVIGSDTGVFIDGKMLGKPHGREEAREMIRELSGRTHTVITGCTLCLYGHETSFSEETYVTFYPLTDAEIEAYLDMEEYSDKAGAYAIQGKGALIVEGIRGDYYNVVGLPVGRLAREIQRFVRSVTQ